MQLPVEGEQWTRVAALHNQLLVVGDGFEELALSLPSFTDPGVFVLLFNLCQLSTPDLLTFLLFQRLSDQVFSSVEASFHQGYLAGLLLGIRTRETFDLFLHVLSDLLDGILRVHNSFVLALLVLLTAR